MLGVGYIAAGAAVAVLAVGGFGWTMYNKGKNDCQNAQRVASLEHILATERRLNVEVRKLDSKKQDIKSIRKEAEAVKDTDTGCHFTNEQLRLLNELSYTEAP